MNKIPHSLEAEHAIIGALLIDEDYSYPLCLQVNLEIFYNYEAKLIFKTAIKTKKVGKTIDLLTITESLKSQGVSGITADKIYKMIESTPTAKNIKFHLDIVNEKYKLRKIQKHAENMLNMLRDETLTSLGYQHKQKGIQTALSVNMEGSDSLKSQMLKMLRQVSSKESAGISTGYLILDRKMGGLIPSDLIIIGGRPSMGKTALAVGMMSNILKQEKRVLFFSLEMSTSKILRRIVSIRTGIVLETLKNGQASRAVMSKLTEAGSDLCLQDFIIDDRPSLTVDDITSKSLIEHTQKPVDLIVIDYLQRMKHPKHKGMSESSSIGESVIGLKSLAKTLNVPVILLSQLSRNVEYRGLKEPCMSDLRSSGDIEQEADIVIFPYRPEQAKEAETQENPTRLIIAKHRDGGLGAAPVNWIPELAYFDNKY